MFGANWNLIRKNAARHNVSMSWIKMETSRTWHGKTWNSVPPEHKTPQSPCICSVAADSTSAVVQVIALALMRKRAIKLNSFTLASWLMYILCCSSPALYLLWGMGCRNVIKWSTMWLCLRPCMMAHQLSAWSWCYLGKCCMRKTTFLAKIMLILLVTMQEQEVGMKRSLRSRCKSVQLSQCCTRHWLALT